MTETANEQVLSLNTVTNTIIEGENVLEQQSEEAVIIRAESNFVSAIHQDDEETQQLESDEVEEVENNDIEEAESVELNENEFQLIDSEVGSVPEGSVIDRYLAEIQRKMREGEISDQFLKKNFWIYPTSAYFVLQESTIDPNSLCIPKVFIWIPHKLQNNLKCPYCKSDIEVKGHCNNPRARRVVDLFE